MCAISTIVDIAHIINYQKNRRNGCKTYNK